MAWPLKARQFCEMHLRMARCACVRAQVKLGFNNWALGKQQLALAPAPQLEQRRAPAPAPAGSEPTWQAVSFTVPEAAYEMQFALTDGQGKWDNTAGGWGGDG